MILFFFKFPGFKKQKFKAFKLLIPIAIGTLNKTGFKESQGRNHSFLLSYKTIYSIELVDKYKLKD